MSYQFLIPFLLFSCGLNQIPEPHQAPEQKTLTMKQPNFDDYKDLWAQVSAYEKLGQTKSAFGLVQKIYQKARKDHNSPQLVKALLYQSKYMMVLEEDSQLKIVNNFKKVIDENAPPTKNILESYLAQLYWQYYQANRWRFANRTATESKVDANDFRTWDLKTLFKEVSYYFDQSLKDEQLLLTADIKSWKTILNLSDKAEKFQPALFDLLAYEALKFYKNPENNLASPAYKFVIDNPAYLSDAKTFVSLKIDTKDTLSQQFKALKLYQKWLKNRLIDTQHFDALALVDLNRLRFVYKKAVFPDKDSIYFKQLQVFIKSYHNSEVITLAYYQQALLLNKQGETYRPQESENRWKKAEAVKLCDEALTLYPDSEGTLLCKQLKAKIQRPLLSLQIEKNIPKNQSALMRINYKNLSNVDVKIYSITFDQQEELNNLYKLDQQKKFIENLPLVESEIFRLKNEQDYQQHSTERLLKALPNGNYIYSVSRSNAQNSAFDFAKFQVTDAAIQVMTKGADHKIFVYNRQNGHAIPNAKVIVKKQAKRNHWLPYKTLSTNQKGVISFNENNRRYYQDYLFEVHYGNGQKAYFESYLQKTHHERNLKAFNTAFIFTDRKIYRPGQTVYFKAICLQKKVNQSEVLPKQNVKVTLYDVNRQKVSQLHLTTNDFGSVNGSFILPESGLTGRYTIEISANHLRLFNNTDIRVEAYKRPKFEVALNLPEKAYKVNDSIEVTGLAESFAGTKITGAKVTYRVQRETEMPRWWYWFRPSFTSEAQEIAFGQSKTDDQGHFKIRFKALPDLSVKPEQNPVFRYKVYAEVTDLNGETHTSEITVKAGYSLLQAKLDVADEVQKNKRDTIKISITNLNDVKVPATGSIKIYKLKAPDRVLRKRPWPAPDYQELSYQDFVANLPHMPYNDKETNPFLWDKAGLFFTADFDTSKSSEITWLPKTNWPSGKYLAVLKTKDREGHLVTDKKVIDIFDDNDQKIPDNQYLATRLNQTDYKPGDMVIFKIGSAAKGNQLHVWVEKNHQFIKKLSPVSDGRFVSVAVPVTEKDRGGFAIRYTYHAFNDYRTGTKIISVPYPSKQLEVETLRFRDKLQPGQKEHWQFKIKGTDAEQKTAEVLASMYDASLDQFVANDWHFNPINYHYYQPAVRLSEAMSYGISRLHLPVPYVGAAFSNFKETYVSLKWFGFRFSRNFYPRPLLIRGARKMENIAVEVADDAEEVEEVAFNSNEVHPIAITEDKNADKEKMTTEPKTPKIRTNFNETAFFYPNLYTDKNGHFIIDFEAPESLTKWKLQILGHTKNLDYAYKKLFATTQKDLMVFPNAPRFVREGDEIVFSTKISNLTDKDLSGQAYLSLVDAVTQKDITGQLLKDAAQKSFMVSKEGNTFVVWHIKIPKDVEAIQYTVKASAGNQSDAEQSVWPVLSNRLLVTETLPMFVRSGQTKTFTLDKLLHLKSHTVKQHQLTLEMTSNPAWYAVQALPYLMKYPYECSEQTFSRYYANALAGHIIQQQPKIKQVFDLWRHYDADALLSNLEKNQSLKSILITETPWLLDAKNETEQKKRIALLFDLNKMSYEQQSAVNKLKQLQLSNGGFTWFKGGRYANRFITSYIVEGFGHLKHLGVLPNNDIKNMTKKAIGYLDRQLVDDYNELIKQAKKEPHYQAFLDRYHPNVYQLHYLYARSFYPEIKLDNATQKAMDYYRAQAQKYWLSYALYEKGLLALISQRHKDYKVAKTIIRSLDENSINSENLGMYWKENTAGLYWSQAPIETQALLIEAFAEVDGDIKKIDNMRIWLLKHKQTNAWKTTKQTTEAIYALLLRGQDWLSLDNNVVVKVGRQTIEPSKMPDLKTEAGTGYFKKTWQGEQITPEMGKVTITKKGKGVAWGALYWQYFEDIDKITNAKTNLAITKSLFIRTFTDQGEVLKPITDKHPIKVGDLVKVHIEIKVDRPMEYVHLKDLRASGFEPVNVLSTYKYQDGLAYYESTGDAATNFFIDYLPKGVYVFEYDLRANMAGHFSNGIANMQCMYAPEFTSHSKGESIIIKP